jgi:hypothetical protein
MLKLSMSLTLIKKKRLTSYFVWNTSVVDAGLPKSANEALDVTHNASFVGKVHFPDEGPVTEDPHSKRNRLKTTRLVYSAVTRNQLITIPKV